MNRSMQFLLIAFTALIVVQRSGAQQSAATVLPEQVRVLHAARIVGAAPVLDGRLDDPAWKIAEVSGDFTQREPNAGAPATVRTEARVVYDDDAVYVAMRMYDPDPKSIMSTLTRRDDISIASDRAGVYIDSYNDHRTAFGFVTTPRGAKSDELVFDDTKEDWGWDAVWDVATAIDSLGWTAEFRIPLSQLRYSAPKGTKQLVWSVQFQREFPRNAEESYWSPFPPNTGRAVSHFGELRVDEPLATPRRLEFMPYSVGKLTRSTGDAANPFYSHNATAGAVGADLKYGLTSNLTLTATINPDFGQVEADPSVVNLGSFETFFPEKRPFFTEGSEIFNFTLGPEAQVLYSRRIGRPPQRSVDAPGKGFVDVPGSSRILGAAKLSGKTQSGWALGFMHAVTQGADAQISDSLGVAHTEPVEPLTNYSVARLSRDFRGGKTLLGFLGTSAIRSISDSRLDFLRTRAYTGSFNWAARFGENQYEYRGRVIGSGIKGSSTAITAVERNSVHRFQRPDATHLKFDSLATSMYGWGGETSVRKIAGSWTWILGSGARSPGFELNDLGFQTYADVWYTRANLNYRVFNPGRVFRNWTFDTNWIPAWTWGGERVRNTLDATLSGTLRNLWNGSLFLERWPVAITPWDLRGGPAMTTIATTDWNAYLSTNQREKKSFALASDGTLSDGGHGLYGSIAPTFFLRPSAATSFSIAPRLSWNWNETQYIRTVNVAGSSRYILGEIHQKTAALVTRSSVVMSPALSFDLYLQPFISGGTYRAIKEVVAPRANDFNQRFSVFGANRISFDPATNRYSIDLQPDGKIDFTMANPNFNVRQFRSNAVVRWEYRPGSTLFVVWSQSRDDELLNNGFNINRDALRLFGIAPKNIFLVKLSYWLGQ